MKSKQDIIDKLGFTALNDMQKKANEEIHKQQNVLLLSPTGSGKTVAFLLPLIAQLEAKKMVVQALILVPSRELALQIEQVARSMGSGYKINAVYGGRPISKDKIDLIHPPAILIGTPGRIADHIRRKSFPLSDVRNLILDEFDKSLQVGFESDMKEIVGELQYLDKVVLTSATQSVEIPGFIPFQSPSILNFLDEAKPSIQLKQIVSPEKDKMQTLVNALFHIGPKQGIVFCNFRESIQRVSDFLNDNNIEHGCFYGGMEQKDREQTLLQFRNGSHRLIVATDLAARGIDVPEIDFIIHYHLPQKEHEFVHRNGRTARMKKEGVAYVIQWDHEILPDYLEFLPEEKVTEKGDLSVPEWVTIRISGGRLDKISKGDIAGFFLKSGLLEKDELGTIELKQDCSYAAINRSKSAMVLLRLNNKRLKKRKVRLNLL